jgi:tRNA(Ile)-lysidine synthase
MQAELFILRLSRNSGVLGLAGMPFTSQIFSTHSYSFGEVSNNHGILLVRPLLIFSKEDMYKVSSVESRTVEDVHCQFNLISWVCHRNFVESSLIYLLQICLWGNQECVEDPTNQILLFSRNRIRMSLRDLSSCELTEMIALMV